MIVVMFWSILTQIVLQLLISNVDKSINIEFYFHFVIQTAWSENFHVWENAQLRDSVFILIKFMCNVGF